ncbi:MAG: hypothetical protein ACMZ7B_06625 [Balneola sp.]
MYHFAIFSLLLLFGYSGKIDILIPTVEQETEYVWRTIQNISFFDEYGYDISLPEGSLIESLKTKSREKTLNNEDYKALSAFMKEKVYKKSDYEKGYKKVVSETALLESLIGKIKNAERNWDFRFFETYTVTLTLYGPGGGYNPEEGSILLFTTLEGGFKQYENPRNTIIHEIIHIGVEESIMQKYDVPHGLKERIIDTFVHLNFKDQLPDYCIQNMGDTRLDSLLSEKKDLIHLEGIVIELLGKDY